MESILSFLILFGSASSQMKSLCSFRSVKSGIRETRGMVHAVKEEGGMHRCVFCNLSSLFPQVSFRNNLVNYAL